MTWTRRPVDHCWHLVLARLFDYKYWKLVVLVVGGSWILVSFDDHHSTRRLCWVPELIWISDDNCLDHTETDVVDKPLKMIFDDTRTDHRDRGADNELSLVWE